MKRLAVIDGKSIFYRGYYAMPNLATKEGVPTGGVFGFASLAIELIKKIKPDYVAVAWDKPKTNIRKRREIYPEYKAGRKPAPADFYEQIPILHELLEAFGWPMYEIDDYEADDIMGAFAKEAEERGVETYLLTSDLDSLQLISPKTKVYAIKNGLSNLEEFDVGHFEQKYGIRVDQFLDLKSLKGDSSDNLPGVPGVGEKTAVGLLQQYDTLENIYENLEEIKPTIAKKLEAGRELAFMTKEVGRIWTDVPVELDWGVADVDDTDLEKVAEILKRLEFTSLVRRLPDYMQVPVDKALHFEQSQLTTVKRLPWPDELELEGTVVLQARESELWLSPNDTTVFVKEMSEVEVSAWKALEFAKVVSYDVKALYHQLDKCDVKVKFGEVHDIRQAAFLIDPLRRDRSVAALVGEDATSVEAEMAGLWQVYAWQTEAFGNLPEVSRVAHELDFPVIWPLFQMERRGILLDSQQLVTMGQGLAEELVKIEQEIYSLVDDEFNISSPAQLSEVLFVKLQLPTAGIKKGKTAYSTDQKTLDKLRGTHPIIELIERSRELAKLKNTYVDTLPLMADRNSRVHTTFNQDVAATGRLSSTDPNLQNIPVRSELGRQIRRAFVPSGGKVFVSADYSQFELRLAAVLADDKGLIDDFNGDVDIHAKTASDVYGVPLEEVTKDQRRDAKVINFGVLYGMSPHGLSAATGMSFTQAKQFIDHYFELRAPIRRYIDLTLEKARNDGYVETYFGRRRPTPDIHSSNFMVRQSAERVAANMPIQGTEADLMKRAMILVEDELSDRADQLLQIHDSILVECNRDDASEIADRLRNIMENIAPELEIKLKVDVSVGDNWGEA
jgi:DNA polymerase-1